MVLKSSQHRTYISVRSGATPSRLAPRNVLVRQVRARTPPLHGSEFKDDIYIDLAFAAQSSLSKHFRSLILPIAFGGGGERRL